MTKRESSDSKKEDSELQAQFNRFLEEGKSLFASKVVIDVERAMRARRICDDLTDTAAGFERSGDYGSAQKAYNSAVKLSERASIFATPGTGVYARLHQANGYAAQEYFRLRDRK